MLSRRVSPIVAVPGAIALVAALIIAAIYTVVLWRIATNAQGATADFISFYSAGWLVRGEFASAIYDPETLAWSQRLLYPGTFDEAFAYLLPVFVAWGFAPLSLLPYTFAYFVWFGLNAALLIAVMGAIDRQVLRGTPRVVRASFLIVAGLGMPAIATLVFGQVDIVVLAGLTAGYLLLRAEKPGWAGLALTAVLIKPHFIAGAALYLLASRQWKALASLAAAGLPLIVLPALLTSPALLWENVQMLASSPGSDAGLSVNAEVMANWRGFIISASGRQDPLLWLPGLVVIAVGALYLAWPRWQNGAPGAPALDRAYSLAVLLPLLISPHLHTQSLLLLALPGALALRAYSTRGLDAARQDRALAVLFAFYAALFLLPFFAIQGLSLTAFLVLGTYAWLALRWPSAAALEPRTLAPEGREPATLAA
jgi:hypothetical protein